jgi:uncharacterized protein YndB with AHSA1/START domain
MPTPTASLTVQKILPCRPAEAFRAWTEPALFQQWFIPMPGMRATAKVDLRPGGKYQIFFVRSEEQPNVIVDGEFIVIDPPHYLEYTWILAEAPCSGSPNHTVVKVAFRDLGEERTEVVLTHEGFTNPEDGEGHNRGWTSILEHMAAALGAEKRGV